MPFSTLALSLFVGLSVAGYTLEDDYMSGGNFFSMFDFFTDSDPTGGFVQYVDQSTASSNGYINASSNSVYIGTDYTNVASSSGRQSVRLTSTKAYDSGLVILDLGHMPGGICGTWPAFWMVGPNWPAGGEIDIIEGVNEQTGNDMTLHTSQGCQISNNGGFSGNLGTTDCWVDDPNQGNNAGCQISSSDSATYGSGFNSNNGGVYAMEYTSSTISVYFFPRSSIPSDVSSGSPDPTTWGTPLSYFTGCDVANYFQNQQIVFDLTFCGQWAGSVWSSGSCASKADSCNAYVQNNPADFQDAYWKINALQVYQNNGYSSNVVSTTPAPPSQPATSAIASPSSVWAVGSSSYAAPPSTFAISTKSAPLIPTGLSHVPLPPSASVSPYAGNGTSAIYPTGSGTGIAGTAPLPTGTGIIGSAPMIPPSAPSSVAVASAPSSPPEVLPSSSVTAAATAAPETTEAATHTWPHWHHNHHGYEPPAAAVKRHLRQHKRHGAGRF